LIRPGRRPRSHDAQRYPRGAVLIDLDGTLIDSEPVNRELYDRFFADRGWSVDEVTYSQFIGRRAIDVFASAPGPWSGHDPEVLYEEVLAYLPHLDERPLALAGAGELLHDLADAGVPTAIVTSATPFWVEMALRDVLTTSAGSPVVDVRVTAEDVVRGKPDPEGYLLACSRLGISPGNALVLEDAPAGVAAARAAGAGYVLAVTTTHPAAALETAGADEVAVALPRAAQILAGAL
jgi:mannitol-1-/sugar-/sorbitol-6-phosphatase